MAKDKAPPPPLTKLAPDREIDRMLDELTGDEDRHSEVDRLFDHLTKASIQGAPPRASVPREPPPPDKTAEVTVVPIRPTPQALPKEPPASDRKVWWLCLAAFAISGISVALVVGMLGPRPPRPGATPTNAAAAPLVQTMEAPSPPASALGAPSMPASEPSAPATAASTAAPEEKPLPKPKKKPSPAAGVKKPPVSSDFLQ